MRERVCHQFRPGDVTPRRAQIKHGAGEMFHGMHLTLGLQNFLSPRNVHIVDELAAEVGESGAIGGAGKSRQPHAARAPVKIQAKLRSPVPERGRTCASQW